MAYTFVPFWAWPDTQQLYPTLETISSRPTEAGRKKHAHGTMCGSARLGTYLFGSTDLCLGLDINAPHINVGLTDGKWGMRKWLLAVTGGSLSGVSGVQGATKGKTFPSGDLQAETICALAKKFGEIGIQQVEHFWESLFFQPVDSTRSLAVCNTVENSVGLQKCHATTFNEIIADSPILSLKFEKCDISSHSNLRSWISLIAQEYLANFEIWSGSFAKSSKWIAILCLKMFVEAVTCK